MKTIEEIKITLEQDRATLEKALQMNSDSFPDPEIVGDYERGNLEGWIEALEWVSSNNPTGDRKPYLNDERNKNP
jgi:hypothetical protein